MAIIQSVLNHYGVYSAELEREYVRSQQRPDGAVTTVPALKPGSARSIVGAWLRAHPHWWTVSQIVVATKLRRELVVSACGSMAYSGEVDRERPPIKGAQIHRGQMQRYRWRG